MNMCGVSSPRTLSSVTPSAISSSVRTAASVSVRASLPAVPPGARHRRVRGTAEGRGRTFMVASHPARRTWAPGEPPVREDLSGAPADHGAAGDEPPPVARQDAGDVVRDGDHCPATSRAVRNTSSIMSSVSTPVNVFCWRGGSSRAAASARPSSYQSAPWPNFGRGRGGRSAERGAQAQRRVPGERAEADDDAHVGRGAAARRPSTAGRCRARPASACWPAARSGRRR